MVKQTKKNWQKFECVASFLYVVVLLDPIGSLYIQKLSRCVYVCMSPKSQYHRFYPKSPRSTQINPTESK